MIKKWSNFFEILLPLVTLIKIIIWAISDVLYSHLDNLLKWQQQNEKEQFEAAEAAEAGTESVPLASVKTVDGYYVEKLSD